MTNIRYGKPDSASASAKCMKDQVKQARRAQKQLKGLPGRIFVLWWTYLRSSASGGMIFRKTRGLHLENSEVRQTSLMLPWPAKMPNKWRHTELYSILASCSPFFKTLLMRFKRPHQILYMRGLKLEDLTATLDFIYYGETSVYQENFD